ncbi:hypothetical protein [Mariniblastus fucicola]|uniref:Uncharacterized protein n=1 Tax=Mariniblastus fucicola TaxID=980251 RepID=A0A5B9PDK5_9BACT|nr:hypothetical protein [Mariniblastus fucicola]QEG24468.1 hypothetical protein MFFC18_43880 [Mariniblastus fucicola]
MSQANSDMDDFGGALEYDSSQPAEAMPQLAPAPVYRKKGINIYTLMLILSLLFLTAGAIFLFANLGNYQL